MCGGTCGENTSCTGTCVTGNFYGLETHTLSQRSNPINFQGLHIHEFSIVDITLPSGCSQGGGIFNPTSVVHGSPEGQVPGGETPDDPIEVGSLGNVQNNESDCRDAAPYARCFTNLEFEGMESIIGRSVVIHKGPDYGSKPNANNPLWNPVACGTITTDKINVDFDLGAGWSDCDRP